MEDISYNIFMEDKRKEERRMSPRTGRPTSNPKSHKITVRLDEESHKIMNDYCEQQKVEKGEAVRRGIKKLKDDLK